MFFEHNRVEAERGVIAVEMAGRMGNQLFIYAFALSAAKGLRCPMLLLFDPNDPKTFAVPADFECPRFHARRNRLLLEVYFRVQRFFPRDFWDADTPPVALLLRLRRFVRYAGYMQAPAFFESHRGLVRRELAVRPEHRRSFAAAYGDRLGRRPSIVVHVRRADYRAFGNEELGWDLRLPWSYYDDCLGRIADRDRHQILFIGDDLDDVERRYGAMPNAAFERNAPIVDFQLLQAADVAIISNSSYAWWGAYLGAPGRPVFAPRNWLGFKAGFEYPAGITAVPWTWVDVRPGDAA